MQGFISSVGANWAPCLVYVSVCHMETGLPVEVDEKIYPPLQITLYVTPFL